MLAWFDFFSTMYDPKRDALTAPASSGEYYITQKMLQNYKNHEAIIVKSIHCQKGTYVINRSPKPSERFFLCKAGINAFDTTFICYERIDGKLENTRLDKLILVNIFTIFQSNKESYLNLNLSNRLIIEIFCLQDGYVVPDRRNEDHISFDIHIKPLIQNTNYALHKIRTDWPVERVFR